MSYFTFSPPGLAFPAGGAAGALSAAPHGALLLALRHAPLGLELFGDGAPGAPLLTVNGRGLTYVEHRRRKAGADGAGGPKATPTQKERRVLHCCRLCHNAIHRFFSNEDLALRYVASSLSVFL